MNKLLPNFFDHSKSSTKKEKKFIFFNESAFFQINIHTLKSVHFGVYIAKVIRDFAFLIVNNFFEMIKNLKK